MPAPAPICALKAPGHAVRICGTDGIKRAAAGGRPALGGIRMRRYFIGRGVAAVTADISLVVMGGIGFAAGQVAGSHNPSPYATDGWTALDAKQPPSKNYIHSDGE